MFEAQEGRCAICRRELAEARIDHDHITGSVRGLLCQNCNAGIGMLQDDPDILRAAVVYLDHAAMLAANR